MSSQKEKNNFLNGEKVETGNQLVEKEIDRNEGVARSLVTFRKF